MPTGSQPLTLAQFIYNFSLITGYWPSEGETMQAFNSGMTYDQLVGNLRSWRPTSPQNISRENGATDWIVNRMAGQVGPYSAFLKNGELARILLQSISEGWDASKLQASLSNSQYFQHTTAKQREWSLLSPAEQTQAIAEQKINVMQILEKYYGVTQAANAKYSLNDPRVIKWAQDLAEGIQQTDIFEYSIDQAARGVPGTVSYDNLVSQTKSVDKTAVDVSNTAYRLRQSWNQWVGTNIAPPDLNNWAQNIVANQRSEADFSNYIQSVSKSLYPNKPEFISFDDWMKPARSVLTKTFEVGHVPDEDPLMQGYIQGQTPSLADLELQAKRDPRYQTTNAATSESRKLGMDVLKQFGFAE